MQSEPDDDSWLGRLEGFPRVLHAQVSVDYALPTVDLQRAIFRALRGLTKLTRQVQVSIADRQGYFPGKASFKVGIGDRNGFAIFDLAVENHLSQRLEEDGVFPLIDTAVNINYAVRDRKRHSLQGDRYIVRWLFQPRRSELLLHHLGGVKRTTPDEFVSLLLDSVNEQLRKEGHSQLMLSSLERRASLQIGEGGC